MVEIGACNLNREELTRLVETVDEVSLALQAEDWDTERWEDLVDGVDYLKVLANKADKVCVCPPHGLIDPSERMKALERSIKRKDARAAEENLKNLALCILGDI